MEEKLAKIISVLFQPLLIPTYSLLILFNLNSYIALMIPTEGKRLIMWIVFVTTFIVPLVFIFVFYKKGIIKTLYMDTKEERILPLIITGIFYFMAYFMLRKTNIDAIYHRMFLGSAILISLTLVVSIYWKISMHMVGISGILGVLIGVNQVVHVDVTTWILLVTLLCGLVGFARLKLKAHSPAQIYTGFFTGFAIMLFMIIV